MRLFFIRHGHSANNGLPVGQEHQRDPDPPLTGTGHEQTRLLAAYLAAWAGAEEPAGGSPNPVSPCRVTRLLCSPMRRALQTAAVVGPALGLPVELWLDLHEIGGLWEAGTSAREGLPGASRLDFEKEYPWLNLPRELRDPWWNRPWEPLGQAQERARRLLDRLLREFPGEEDAVAVVSHRGLYNVLLTTLLGLPVPDEVMPVMFQLHNAAISLIDLAPGGFRLVQSNQTAFLPSRLVTAFRPQRGLRPL